MSAFAHSAMRGRGAPGTRAFLPRGSSLALHRPFPCSFSAAARSRGSSPAPPCCRSRRGLPPRKRLSGAARRGGCTAHAYTGGGWVGSGPRGRCSLNASSTDVMPWRVWRSSAPHTSEHSIAARRRRTTTRNHRAPAIRCRLTPACTPHSPGTRAPAPPPRGSGSPCCAFSNFFLCISSRS